MNQPAWRGDVAARVTPLQPSFLARLVAGYQVLKTGRMPDWFGPGEPLPPTAPEEVKGRQFDYPVSINTVAIQPKNTEGVSYATLRNAADGLDLVRILVETMKDKLCSLRWSIAYKDPKKKSDARCEQLEQFWQMPDGEHTWPEWLRMIAEDALVCDAAAAYPVVRGGQLLAVEPIDGTTIKRIIDDGGRTPTAPTPAYQQILHGLVANAYTRDELVFKPRNIRTNRIYGYSAIEQVIVTINIALRREASFLQYYTDGSTPDLILSVPDTWTPDQVAQFKQWWDSILSGNSSQTRGTMFVFNGMKAIDTKEKALTSETDEWLMRVLCYAFGISPLAFVKMMNRATSDTAKTSSQEEGLEPWKLWVKSFVGYIMAKYQNAPDVELKWLEDEETDAYKKAQTNDIKLRNGALTVNEWRDEDGRDAVEGGDVPFIIAGATAMTLDRIINPPEPQPMSAFGDSPSPAGKGASATQSGGSPGKPPAGDLNKTEQVLRLVKRASPKGRLKAAMTKALDTLRVSVAEQVAKAAGLAKSTMPTADQIIAALDLGIAENDIEAVAQALADEYGDSWSRALVDVGISDGDPLFDLSNDRAAAYADARAAELLSTDAAGGELGDATRLLIRSTITEALDEGWSLEDLSTALQDDYAFTADRADTIAKTEVNAAQNQGQLASWDESGQVDQVKWLLSADDNVCAICQANADAGPINLGDSFPSGDDAPPAHPNCQCDLAPIRNAASGEE